MSMTSVKLKFRPAANPEKEGALVFQLIHDRTVRRIKSACKIFNDEWDKTAGKIVLPLPTSSRYGQLSLIRLHVKWEMLRLKKIAETLEQTGRDWNLDDLSRKFISDFTHNRSVFNFIHSQMRHKMLLGKVRSAETYQSTLNSFMLFRKGVDLSFEMMDAELMELYEAELQSRGVSRNTSSFYMRILRTNYKLAVERGLTQDNRPFRHVYCGIDKTIKRCISLEGIKTIRQLELSQKPSLDFARDMFIFSFCTRGMSFVDMAYLKKKDLNNGYLTYRRKKTGQQLTIEWTEQMQAILNKYKPPPTKYLLPIILREDGSERRQYQNQMMKINRRLKDIAAMAQLAVPLSMYYTRHSWATIARGKDIPLCIISEGLGHDSETTTQIYLDSIRTSEVDKANRTILNDL